MTTKAQQARFPAASTKRGGTVAERDHWSETDFNWHMRMALQEQGYRATHIRETDEPGKADLLVYQYCDDHDTVEIEAWLELKIHNEVSGIRTGQREFMRDHWHMGHNAMFVMRDRKTALLVIRQGDLKGRTMSVDDDPYKVNWQEVIQAFRSRK